MAVVAAKQVSASRQMKRFFFFVHKKKRARKKKATCIEGRVQKYTNCTHPSAMERGYVNEDLFLSLGQCGLAPGDIVDSKGVCSAAAVLGECKGHALLGDEPDSIACHQNDPNEHQQQSEATDQLLVQQHIWSHLVHHLAHNSRRNDASQSGFVSTRELKKKRQGNVLMEESERTNPEPIVMTVPAVPDISTYSPMYAHSDAHRGPM